MSTIPSPPLATTESLQAALLTPRGRGAVATIRIHGDHTLLDRETPPTFRAANGRRLSEQPFGRIVFGAWGREVSEDVVLCRIDPQTLEIHCHGGERAADRILRDWRHRGAEMVDGMRSATSAADLLEAEIGERLSRSVTWRTAEYLLSQAEGRLRAAVQRLATVAWTDAGRRQAAGWIQELLQWADFGIHLTQPWRVVVTGRPNVGKSSLINALLGYQRSIVFDQPGTTRDVVTAETAFDGWPVQLADTAGLRSAAESLEAMGIASARQHLAEADLVVHVVDVHEPEEDLDSNLFELPGGRSSLIVAHKCDLPDRWGAALPAGAQRVSSLTGAGILDLQQALVRRLVPDAPPVETPLPITPRQAAALRAAQAEIASESTESAFRDAVAELITGARREVRSMTKHPAQSLNQAHTAGIPRGRRIR